MPQKSLKLSIVIPCYNCQDTLREAVDSCYTQGFLDTEFEIIMVDDGSTDTTPDILAKLQHTHANIRVIAHEQNKGGGATRNTAVAHTQSDLIFCLDSDDILPPTVLPRMVAQIKEERVDGVLFEATRYFTKNTETTTNVPNTISTEPIILQNLFEKDAGYLTQVNFLYTKNAFEIIGGYPTNHGFDTQTFGLLFLARGLDARICPDTFYYHRQSQSGSESYYEREYGQGLISINTYLAIESIIDTLDDPLVEQIILFDIFKKNTHGEGKQLRSIIAQYVENGNQLQKTLDKKRSELTETYVTMIAYLQEKKYKQAQASLEACITLVGKETPLLQYMRQRILYSTGGISPVETNKKVIRYLQDTHLLNIPKRTRMPKLVRILRHLYLRLKNIYGNKPNT